MVNLSKIRFLIRFQVDYVKLKSCLLTTSMPNCSNVIFKKKNCVLEKREKNFTLENAFGERISVENWKFFVFFFFHQKNWYFITISYLLTIRGELKRW